MQATRHEQAGRGQADAIPDGLETDSATLGDHEGHEEHEGVREPSWYRRPAPTSFWRNHVVAGGLIEPNSVKIRSTQPRSIGCPLIELMSVRRRHRFSQQKLKTLWLCRALSSPSVEAFCRPSGPYCGFVARWNPKDREQLGGEGTCGVASLPAPAGFLTEPRDVTGRSPLAAADVILSGMKIAKFHHPAVDQPTDEPVDIRASVTSGSLGRIEGDTVLPLDLSAAGLRSLTELLDAEDPIATAESLPAGEPLPLDSVKLLPPIDRQEIWAAGVTYRRSQSARMEESEAAASCYDRVYTADRPELFFKASPSRVRGHGQPLRIRADASWNVPEPEITLVLDRKLRIVGLTVGNDMSSRDIEGDNPLYLPQAKCYDACAGLGPWITLARPLPPREEIGVQLRIERDGNVVFSGESGADQMARGFDDLVGWLGRDNVFPDGAFLMTGTGIVPDSSFTLKPGDLVHISVDGVGTLSNEIIQGTVPTTDPRTSDS